MRAVTLSYPELLEQVLEVSPEQFVQEMRLRAALKWFELGRIPSGEAAELAGVSRAEFLDLCGRHQVSIYNYPPEGARSELQADLKALER